MGPDYHEVDVFLADNFLQRHTDVAVTHDRLVAQTMQCATDDQAMLQLFCMSEDQSLG
jgi:hypothetical protein